MSERKNITTPILKACIQLGIFAMRVNSGKVKVRGGWVQLAPAGTADIAIYPRDQRPVWVETKIKDGELSDEQCAFADRVADLGHSYWTIQSLEEILPLLEELR